MLAVADTVRVPWSSGVAVVVVSSLQIDIHRLRAIAPADWASATANHLPKASAEARFIPAGKLNRGSDQFVERRRHFPPPASG